MLVFRKISKNRGSQRFCCGIREVPRNLAESGSYPTSTFFSALNRAV